MKRHVLAVAAALLTYALFAIGSWAAGYDFDRRGFDVAWWFFVATVAAAWSADGVYLHIPPERSK